MQKRCLFSLLFLTFCTLLCGQVCEQSPWPLQEATQTYPRSILGITEVDSVRNSLADAPWKAIYAGIFSSAAREPADLAGLTAKELSVTRRSNAFIAKNAAFVYLMNRDPSGKELNAESASLLKSKVIHIFNGLVTDVGSIAIDFGNWQYNSKAILSYAVAFDLLRGAGVADEEIKDGKDLLIEFVEDQYQQSIGHAPSANVNLYDIHPDNHSTMLAAGIGIAAIVLDDAPEAKAWLHLASYQIDRIHFDHPYHHQMIRNEIGGYGEGPGYARYNFENVFPFIEAMKNYLPDGTYSWSFSGDEKNVRHPGYDPSYTYLLDWANAIRLPDGRLPSLEDSYVSVLFPEGGLLEDSSKNFSFSYLPLTSALGTNVDIRVHYLAAQTPQVAPTGPLFQVLPLSGNVVYRSDWSEEAIWMHLYAQHGTPLIAGGGHNQGDDMSFQLYYKGEIMAIDPGYSSWDDRDHFDEAEHHNLVLVDGKGPKGGRPDPSEAAMIDNSFQADSAMFSQISAAYEGADLRRKTAFIGKSYFCMADYMTSRKTKTYTYQLHGAGTYKDNGNATDTWEKNGVKLTTLTLSQGGKQQKATRSGENELGYKNIGKHTILDTSVTAQQSEFLTILKPHTDESFQMSSLSSGDSRTIAKYQETGRTDIIWVQSESGGKNISVLESGLKQDISGDGELNIVGIDDTLDEVQTVFVESGTYAAYGKNFEIRSTIPQIFFWQQSSANEQYGKVSKASRITLSLMTRPLEVNGDDIKSYEFDDVSGILLIEFSGESSFFIRF